MQTIRFINIQYALRTTKKKEKTHKVYALLKVPSDEYMYDFEQQNSNITGSGASGFLKCLRRVGPEIG